MPNNICKNSGDQIDKTGINESDNNSLDVPSEEMVENHKTSTSKKVHNYVEYDRDESMEHLPILEYREEIEKIIKNNSTSVIIGHTGSGKTTKIPEIAKNILPEGSKILVSQPRRLAASSVSKYVAQQMGTNLGDKVGYQIRFDDMTSLGTDINFATDGIILSKLQSDPLLEDYDCVMVDEAHERSLNIDFLLGSLKIAQKARKEKGLSELKIIVTSATIEKEKFMEYFGDAPSIEVPGRLYPVEINYLEEPTHNISKSAAETVEYICNNKGDKGDILIFMPGQSEINQTISNIEYLSLEGLDIMPLHGSLDAESQDRIFKKSENRKVIVSTNIAETSLTLPGVKYVIDSGLIKQTNYNPNSKVTILENVEHSKAGCTQRTGRAGRVGAGECYRLYTLREFETRESFGKAEIIRSNLGNIILKMKNMGISIDDFDFIDAPDPDQINEAIITLTKLGALDISGNITKLGKNMVKIPLEPHLARMLIESEKYDATNEVSTIMAFMGTRNVFVRPKGNEYEADEAHKQFEDEDSDFITLLNVWNAYESHKGNKNWCRANYINFKVIQEVKQIRFQLLHVLRNMGIYPSSDKSNSNDIKKSITAGMIEYIMVNNYRSYSYSNVQNGNDNIFIHPSSGTFGTGSELMIAAKIMTTSKTFAMTCQRIEVDDIKEFAPYLLTQSRKGKYFINEETGKVEEEIFYNIGGREIVNIEKVYGEESKRVLLGYIYDNISRINEDQYECITKINYLYIRSNLDINFLLTKENFIDLLCEKIGNNVKQCDIFSQIQSGKISIIMEDLGISSEDIANVEKKSPESIIIKNREYKIVYGIKSCENTPEAIIEVDEDFLEIDEGGIQKLEALQNIVFSLEGYKYDSIKEVKDKIVKNKINALLLKFNNEHKKEYKRDEINEEIIEKLGEKETLGSVYPFTDIIHIYSILEYDSWYGIYKLKYIFDEDRAISHNEEITQKFEKKLIEDFQEKNVEKIDSLKGIMSEIVSQLNFLGKSNDEVIEGYNNEISTLKYSQDLGSLEKEMNDYFLGLKEKGIELQRQIDEKDVLKDFGGLLRTGGATNNQDYWVIDQDGNMRDYDSILYPRSHNRGTPTVNWKIVEADEIALYWAKGNSAGEHHFEIMSMVIGGKITDKQFQVINNIENSIDERWKDAKGLASGKLSPSVGKGWGLTGKLDDTTPLLYKDGDNKKNNDDEIDENNPIKNEGININNPFSVLKDLKISDNTSSNNTHKKKNIPSAIKKRPNILTSPEDQPTKTSLDALLNKYK